MCHLQNHEHMANFKLLKHPLSPTPNTVGPEPEVDMLDSSNKESNVLIALLSYVSIQQYIMYLNTYQITSMFCKCTTWGQMYSD